MSSSFSISPTSGGSGFAPQQSSNSDQSTGSGFGALLDMVGNIGNDVAGAIGKLTSTQQPATQTGFTRVAAPGTTNSSDAASAAGTDADGAGTPPRLLHDLVDSLTQLQDAENSGNPVDPALIKKAKNALDAISNFLSVQQPLGLAAQAPGAAPDAAAGSTPGVNALGASGSGSTDAGSTAAGGAKDAAEIAAAQGLLTQLDGKLQSLSKTLSTMAPDLAGKLDDLAKSLDPSKLSSDTLTQLGLAGSDSGADPKLATAINGLVHGTPQPAPTLQPSLGTAQLKLPSDVALPGTHSSTSDNSSKSSGTTQAAPANNVTGLKSAAAGSLGGRSTGDGSKGDGGKSASSAAADAANAQAVQAQGTIATPASDTSASGTAITPQAAAGLNAATPTAQAAQAAYTPAAAQVNLPQMAYEIAHRAQSGSNQFEIKLDPAEMGRVDVKLAFDSSGAVSAKLTVERPETLALLQRDAGALGQALTQAGLDGSKTSLQFSLSQNPFAGQNGGNGNGRANSGSQAQASEDDLTIDSVGAAPVTNLYRGTVSASGLNIVV
ncbi:MAG TPA: flagellar hook-length control protein FliK [Devosiaceae bacterium]|nr:flagellar hook-length control protein FliK [Devosiaceae bacterium]